MDKPTREWLYNMERNMRSTATITLQDFLSLLDYVRTLDARLTEALKGATTTTEQKSGTPLDDQWLSRLQGDLMYMGRLSVQDSLELIATVRTLNQRIAAVNADRDNLLNTIRNLKGKAPPPGG